MKKGCNCWMSKDVFVLHGEHLIYKCTILGEPGGSTVWLGSAFNCTSHEISLFHSEYESTTGAYGDCADIVGQSV